MYAKVLLRLVIVMFFMVPAEDAAAAAAATAGEATFVVPEGWRAELHGDVTLVLPPESDLRLAIVHVGSAQRPEDAAEHAWVDLGNEHAPPVHRIVPEAAREGWLERATIEYKTSPAAHRAVSAEAWRAADGWTVVIVDGDTGTLEKRGVALWQIVYSLHPPGYSKENFSGRTAHRLDPDRVQVLLTFVRDAARKLNVPGAALALVDHGQVVFEGGIGVQDLQSEKPVDAHTLFMVASNTKGMTTLLLARLVDAGELRWDEPVTQAYPGFRLGSDDTTRRVQVRHLVCACTGLPRKDMESDFLTTRDTPASNTFKLLATTQPTSNFGELFQYNNLMASAAGYVAAHAIHPSQELGAAYDAAMRDLIFNPLGMHETTFSMPQALQGNHANPYDIDLDGALQQVNIHYNDVDFPYRPAGGAWSSAHDMIRYVQNELSVGVLPDGKRWVSEKNLLERRARGVAIGENAWYGMGLMETATTGVSLFDHGGSLWGYKSDLYFIPDARVGAVLLTNSDTGYVLTGAFGRRLLEVLYDGEPQAAEDVTFGARSLLEDRAAFRRQLSIPPTEHAMAQLAQHYESDDLGPLDVLREPGQVRFKVTAWTSQVASRINDDGSISFVTTDPGNWGRDFLVAGQPSKHQLTIKDGQQSYVFTEKSVVPAGR